MGGLGGFFKKIGRWIKKHKLLAILIVIVVICVAALVFFPECALATFLKGAWTSITETVGGWFEGATWSGAADVAAKTTTSAVAAQRIVGGGGNTASPAIPQEPGVAGSSEPPSGWNNVGEAVNKVSSAVADKAAAYVASGQAAKDYSLYKGTTSIAKNPNKYLPIIALVGGGFILLSLLRR